MNDKTKTPSEPQAPAAPQRQMVRCAVVPQNTIQQITDFLRDVPAPRKQTDALIAAISVVQYAEFPIGPTLE